MPVRISRATSNIADVIDFYGSLFRADVYAFDTDSEFDVYGDGADSVSSVFVKLSGAQIELQFVQRPLTATFGDFTVDQYDSLLRDTHTAAISSPFCGQDRWMDNNVGYSTWELPGGLDAVYSDLAERDEVCLYTVSSFMLCVCFSVTQLLCGVGMCITP